MSDTGGAASGDRALDDPRRAAMVEEQLRARGIADRRVLAAMGSVPRELFVPPELADFAYEDAALPIAGGQTISQPYIVALMIHALELSPSDKVLEIGTGSGYCAAVLGRVAGEVHTVERLRSLAEAARARLAAVGARNVHVHIGDGSRGWAEAAPYDGIVVTAGSPRVPHALVAQLAEGGRLVIPVGASRDWQELLRVRKQPGGAELTESLGEVRFVPLVGRGGWPS